MVPTSIPSEIVTYIALAVAVAALAWAFRLERKLRGFMQGKDAMSLEDSITAIQASQQELDRFQNETKKALQALHNRLKSAVRGVSTIRFDAFPGTGAAGKQSFASAIISEKGHGVVLSSMHARENTRIFAKPISDFASPHQLSDEEKRALDEARKLVGGK